MSTKIITLPEHFSTGEPTVQLVATPGLYGKTLRERTSLHNVKTAAESPALDFIRNIEPQPGKTVVLVVGLGDHETYGPNRNGDGFPSEPVPGKINSDDVLTKHYQSYDNARVFEHHVNNDPSKAIGKVIKAFWNPHMRRVEVLESFDHDKAPHLLEQITAGEHPAKSMGCAPAGALVHTPSGRKKIEDIALGDDVITHTGAAQSVTELHRRYYEGALYSVYTSNGKSTMTAEHPYAVLPESVVKEPDGNGGLRRRAFNDIDTAHVHWIPAEDLRAGMYVLTPFDTVVEETLTVDECRLLGYYCAEGSLHAGTSASVVFTHHEGDALVEELPALAARLGVKKWKSAVRRNSACARDTALRSSRLFALCDQHVGRLAGQKRLSLELMRQPLEQQLAFLGAVINGDGGTDDKDDFYISTCNEELAHQYQHMGFRCGLYSRVQTIRHKPSALVQKETTEYRVSFSRKGCNVIAPYTVKVAPREMRGPSTGALLGKGFVISKITDIVKLQFSGLVYNFEVDGDNSYVVGNHAVHNCKIPYDVCTICGNKAATRREYCDHLKYEMGQVYPDGTQAAALNPKPKFFDSSWVRRPADRTGHMLKKVARDTAYEIRMPSYDLGEMVQEYRNKAAALGKAAVMEKIVSGGDVSASATGTDNGTLTLVKKYNDTAAHDDSARLPSPAPAMKVLIEYRPSEAVGTTDDAGMPMAVRELVQYFLGRMEAPEASGTELDAVCKHAALITSVFHAYPRFYDEVLKVAGLEQTRVSSELAQKLAAQTPGTFMHPNQAVSDTPLASQHSLFGAANTAHLRPNTDRVSYTDPQGRTFYTNLGAARRTTEALQQQAHTGKAARGAGMLGLGALMGTAGMSALSSKNRMPRRLLGAAGVGAGLAAAGAGTYEALRPTRLRDLRSPMVMTNEGEVVPAYTEMKAAAAQAWQPEMLHIALRRRDGGCTDLPAARKLAFERRVREAEIYDDLSSVLGPTLDLEKIATLLEQSILNADL